MMKTLPNLSNIYAVGDMTADIALVNVGELEGRHAVEKSGPPSRPLIYENISTIMFLAQGCWRGMNWYMARARHPSEWLPSITVVSHAQSCATAKAFSRLW